MAFKTSLWRSTPPAIFSVALGFLGLGMIWRKSSSILPVPTLVGDLLMGIATAFFVFFLASYLAKLAARPAALIEDMRTPPGRAGVSAIGMALMLLSAMLINLGWMLPWVWWTGVLTQIAVMALVSVLISRDAPASRGFNPFQYLTFVGLIVAPIGGVSLGYPQISFWLAMISLVGFVVITIGYGANLMRVMPVQPFRPSLVIVLSPLSLFALMYLQMHMQLLGQAFFWASWIAAVLFMVLAPWLTRGGWTPIWGAFTFPVAAFTSMQITAALLGMGLVATAGAILGLIVATPLILFVAYKSSKAWSRGDLAKKTGASVA
jgi:tellurite resistance protein